MLPLRISRGCRKKLCPSRYPHLYVSSSFLFSILKREGAGFAFQSLKGSLLVQMNIFSQSNENIMNDFKDHIFLGDRFEVMFLMYWGDFRGTPLTILSMWLVSNTQWHSEEFTFKRKKDWPCPYWEGILVCLVRQSWCLGWHKSTIKRDQVSLGHAVNGTFGMALRCLGGHISTVQMLTRPCVYCIRQNVFVYFTAQDTNIRQDFPDPTAHSGCSSLYLLHTLTWHLHPPNNTDRRHWLQDRVTRSCDLCCTSLAALPFTPVWVGDKCSLFVKRRRNTMSWGSSGCL